MDPLADTPLDIIKKKGIKKDKETEEVEAQEIANDIKEIKIKKFANNDSDDDGDLEKTIEVHKIESSTSSSSSIKRKKKRNNIMGLEIDQDAILQSRDGEPIVRQSRRIAQIKIKEEADRRKLEEEALKLMKAESEKKKKATLQTTATTTTATAETSIGQPSDGNAVTSLIVKSNDNSDEEDEENDSSDSGNEQQLQLQQKLEKKKKKKSKNTTTPWLTDSDLDSSDHDGEDDGLYERYESDHRAPIVLKSDHEFSPESEIEDESEIVPTKRARTAQRPAQKKKVIAGVDGENVVDANDRGEDDGDADEDDLDEYACQKCGKQDQPEWILLCDKCDKGYHCSCLIPVLFVIPEGNWFCPPCDQEKLISGKYIYSV